MSIKLRLALFFAVLIVGGCAADIFIVSRLAVQCKAAQGRWRPSADGRGHADICVDRSGREVVKW